MNEHNEKFYSEREHIRQQILDSENDITNRCPGCGKGNQWGELCPQCADRKTIARNQQPGTETQREAELERQQMALQRLDEIREQGEHYIE